MSHSSCKRHPPVLSPRGFVAGLVLLGVGALAALFFGWPRPASREAAALAPATPGDSLPLAGREGGGEAPELDAPPLPDLGAARPAGARVRCRLVCDERPEWTVEARASGHEAAPGWDEPPRAPAGADAVALVLEPGDWELRASAPEFVGAWRALSVPALPPSGEIELDLPLERCARVTGSVQRADGGALDGFRVALVDAAGRALARTRTDTFGAFRLDCAPTALLRLVVGPAAHPAAEPQELEVRPGVTDAGTLLLRPLRDVRVLVVDAGGVPVPDARVRASADLVDPEDETVRTDAAGRAVVLHLPLSEFRLHASHADGARGNTPVGANEPAEEVVIVLRRPGDAPPPNGR